MTTLRFPSDCLQCRGDQYILYPLTHPQKYKSHRFTTGKQKCHHPLLITVTKNTLPTTSTTANIEDFTVLQLSVPVSLDVALCHWVSGSQHFKVMYWLHPSETKGTNQPVAQCHIPQDQSSQNRNVSSVRCCTVLLNKGHKFSCNRQVSKKWC
jgi:hypothetical protein